MYVVLCLAVLVLVMVHKLERADSVLCPQW